MNSHDHRIIQVEGQRRGRYGACRAILPVTLLVLTCALFPSVAQGQEVRIITRDARFMAAELVEITDLAITVRTERGGVETIAIEDCIGLLNPASAVQPRGSGAYSPQGILVLADGQRLPGSPTLGPGAASDVLSWRHRWFGNIGVPLDRIAWTAFRIGAEPPDSGEADVILLTNGDRAEGFITALRDPVEIEWNGRVSTIALDRISAIRLITPPASPAAESRRVWFEDGTVLDVSAVSTDGDGNIHFVQPLGDPSEGNLGMSFGRVAGILFDIASLIPFATLQAHDVEGPVTRYVVPLPEIATAERALGLRDVILRGPLTARYALPAGAQQLMGSARLLDKAQDWPDCELVIAVDGRELFRERLGSERRRLDFDVPVEGSELSIEVTEGGLGPIGDHVVLEGTMVLVDPQQR